MRTKMKFVLICSIHSFHRTVVHGFLFLCFFISHYWLPQCECMRYIDPCRITRVDAYIESLCSLRGIFAIIKQCKGMFSLFISILKDRKLYLLLPLIISLYVSCNFFPKINFSNSKRAKHILNS
jgi:hypothetical protein